MMKSKIFALFLGFSFAVLIAFFLIGTLPGLWVLKKISDKSDSVVWRLLVADRILDSVDESNMFAKTHWIETKIVLNERIQIDLKEQINVAIEKNQHAADYLVLRAMLKLSCSDSQGALDDLLKARNLAANQNAEIYRYPLETINLYIKRIIEEDPRDARRESALRR